MDLRIGATRAGRAMGFDTSSTRPLLLVGDPGCGKTTTARYLTRWWLADTAHHAHIRTSCPHEWADLAGGHQLSLVNEPPGPPCAPGACLVVVDDLDLVGDDWFRHLSRGTIRSILTCPSGHEWDQLVLRGWRPTCLGLVREGSSDPADAAVLDGQGRLDWPSDTVAIIPARRGPIDFPCHRWWIPADGCTSDQSAAELAHPSSPPVLVPVLAGAATAAAVVSAVAR